MSTQKELDEACARLNRLADELEALVARRKRRLDEIEARRAVLDAARRDSEAEDFEAAAKVFHRVGYQRKGSK